MEDFSERELERQKELGRRLSRDELSDSDMEELFMN